MKVFVFNYVTSRKGLIETVRYSNLPKQFYSNLLTLISQARSSNIILADVCASVLKFVGSEEKQGKVSM